MKKLIILSVLLLLFNYQGQSQNKKNITTSQLKINFNRYSFNTLSSVKEKITLKKGEKYLLDFWYIECPPCVRDHLTIKENLSKLKEQNIEVLGISIDRSSKDWRNYLQKHNYSWENYNQYSGDNILKNDLNVELFPTYFIIDDNGIIEKEFGSMTQVLNYLKIN